MKENLRGLIENLKHKIQSLVLDNFNPDHSPQKDSTLDKSILNNNLHGTLCPQKLKIALLNKKLKIVNKKLKIGSLKIAVLSLS